MDEPSPSVNIPKEGVYDAGLPFQVTHVPFNGVGWDEESGNVASAVTLFVKDPMFVELDVTLPKDRFHPVHDFSDVRAKIGLESLKQESITKTLFGCRIRFRKPRRTVYLKGIQVLFLAFGPKEFMTAHPGYRLIRVAWR
ncbi:MAG: hypothetical protein ACLQVY_12320 [Limisphaerales bacterium]